jgi:hypothetical protein
VRRLDDPPLTLEFPSSLEVSRTCMHKRCVTTHVCNVKVHTQNPLFFLVDPSQREQFCAPHHRSSGGRHLSRPGTRRTNATKPSMNCRSWSFVVSCESAGSVEDAPGMGHEEASTVPGHRPQGPQDGQPCVLAEDRAEAAGRRPKYRHRLSAENPTDVGRRPQKPVNRVLKHARYRVVVFGRREKQPVRGDDRLLATTPFVF